MKTYYNEVVEAIVHNPSAKVVRATKYISPTQVVRATRKVYGGKLINGNIELVLTIGKPNYVEREFIKECRKAGEPFPVKNIQLKLLNPKAKKLKRKG